MIRKMEWLLATDAGGRFLNKVSFAVCALAALYFGGHIIVYLFSK